MTATLEALLPPSQSAPPPTTQESLILRGVRWETYTRLQADFTDSHAAHFAYDQAGTFVQRQTSALLPSVKSSDLTRLLREGQQLQRPVWSRRVRESVRVPR